MQPDLPCLAGSIEGPLLEPLKMLLAAISRYGYAMTLRWHLRLVLTAALLALSAPAWGTVYRCLGDDGKLKFSDQPCAEDETESEVEIEIKQPTPVATRQ